MTNMANAVSLSDFQNLVTHPAKDTDPVVPLINAAQYLMSETILSGTRDELKGFIGDALIALAHYANEAGYDLGEISDTHGALINGQLLSARDIIMTNLGVLLWHTRVDRDELREKEAIAGVIIGIAEYCHNHGFDMQDAVTEVLDGRD